MHSRGLREMDEKDVPEVTALWGKYMARFSMAPVMTEDDVRHYFLSGRGRGEVQKGRREGQVVWSYVVEVGSSPRCSSQLNFFLSGSQDPQTHRLLFILHPAIKHHPTSEAYSPPSSILLLLRY